jgi:hypothetical protein
MPFIPMAPILILSARKSDFEKLVFNGSGIAELILHPADSKAAFRIKRRLESVIVNI